MIETQHHTRPTSEPPPPRPFQIAVRSMVILGALAALGCTRAAAGESLFVLEAAVLALAVFCALVPDSHAGLFVFVLIGVDWLAFVDDRATPWLLGAAAGVAIVHTAMAAASVAPASARWTRAMRRRWARRFAVQLAAIGPTWVVAVLVDRVDIDGNAIVMAVALVALALAGMWVRYGSFDRMST